MSKYVVKMSLRVSKEHMWFEFGVFSVCVYFWFVKEFLEKENDFWKSYKKKDT